MPIDYDRLLALELPDAEHSYTEKDVILYALRLGLGQNPLNEDELAFVYEKNLKALPTVPVMLGYAPFWLRSPKIGVNWTKVVHGEHGFTLHRPIAPRGSVIGRTRINEGIDKRGGEGGLSH